MAYLIAPNKNRVLSHLPSETQHQLNIHLANVHLETGQVLFQLHNPIEFVYFPTCAIVSLLHPIENGNSSCVAMIGYDGVVGFGVALGSTFANSNAVVQSPGHAFRMKASQLTKEMIDGGPLMHSILQYSMDLLTQVSQISVCNRHHSILQHLCCWLLLTLDRSPDNKIAITQESISKLLGYRREGITEAAGHLQKLSAIEYHRGHINVLDRNKLQTLCCECYPIIRELTPD